MTSSGGWWLAASIFAAVVVALPPSGNRFPIYFAWLTFAVLLACLRGVFQ